MTERLFVGREDLLDKTEAERMPTFYFSPTSFRQANLDGFANIVAAILPAIPESSIVCELYGGMGLIGLSLINRCRELRCSDENPNSFRAFELARHSLPGELAERAFFNPLAAVDALREGEAAGADVLVVDPPRKVRSEVKTSYRGVLGARPRPFGHSPPRFAPIQ